jgi:hypothetical protein
VTTRKVLVVDLNDAKRNKGETVGITLIHQRRKRKDEWEDIKNISLSSLKGGEGVKLKLDSSTTKKLNEELAKYMRWLKSKAFILEQRNLQYQEQTKLLAFSKDRKIIIERLRCENFAEEVTEQVIA